ncbi:TetR/AcrR family transcriptional regulator [Xylanibacillus composti]|uniref:HTH tetR-type domain-containing protein n=1 Tax=Xylanibacillus composti TaxID=1572762 RepID=A0A8J4H4M2_9BACL|nr:TetR/AcrR family transcriptional regulator [Xylanibacillus composti]MDT9724039.1 TetR/AcrR family transcriptional regulator [Xylanibacillus composti]GIQ69432.1 hypothetical protein XYCOK13_22560 [Xylanibacillus composti]
MKQEERRQRTTRQLLESTKALIREKGCHAITMKDIMEESGLSKGSIFHYVKSKDELFVWVLQEQLEQTNDRFIQAVEAQKAQPTFEGPMREIAKGLRELEAADHVANKVFMYLLGKEDDPTVREVLGQFYERSLRFAEQWIASGQAHGVIGEHLDKGKISELFVLLSLGFRIRQSLPSSESGSFAAHDLAAFMADVLQSDR